MSTIAEILQLLQHGQDLPEPLLERIMDDIMAGQCGDAESAAFLVGLRMKGESAGEIATAARVLRRHMIRWDPGRADVLDTCGTGGDGTGTFNISTATALVVAGAGVPVVKHGNRSVSSKSGSADVLTALGVNIEIGPERARQCLDETGLAFCFAPLFHPALKHIGPIRKRLGVPTIFNCLGPLANPAGATRQLLGVGRVELLDRMAGALAQLGTTHAILVCSQDGLDEVSLSAPTLVREVVGTNVRPLEWSPASFGLGPVDLRALTVADAAASAAVIGAILDGEAGPAADLVLANAAAGLYAAGRVTDLRDGVALARESIASKRARGVLERLRVATRS